MDNETDELLNSILTGNDENLINGIGNNDFKAYGLDYPSEFDQDILSPAGSSSSGGSSNNAANNIDLVDMFANGTSFLIRSEKPYVIINVEFLIIDVKDEESLQGVNPHTNSPVTERPPEKAHDDHDTDGSDDSDTVQKVKSRPRKPNQQRASARQNNGRNAKAGGVTANRVASTNVYHHAGIKSNHQTIPASRTISIVRPTAMTNAGTPTLLNHGTPITLANGSLDTATTTIFLPVLNSVRIVFSRKWRAIRK